MENLEEKTKELENKIQDIKEKEYDWDSVSLTIHKGKHNATISMNRVDVETLCQLNFENRAELMEMLLQAVESEMLAKNQEDGKE